MNNNIFIGGKLLWLNFQYKWPQWHSSEMNTCIHIIYYYYYYKYIYIYIIYIYILIIINQVINYCSILLSTSLLLSTSKKTELFFPPYHLKLESLRTVIEWIVPSSSKKLGIIPLCPSAHNGPFSLLSI